MADSNSSQKSGGSLTDIKGVGPARAKKLKKAGFKSIQDVADATPKQLAKADVSASVAKNIITAAKKASGATAKKKSSKKLQQKRSVRVTKDGVNVSSPTPSYPRIAIAALVVLVVAVAVFFIAQPDAPTQTQEVVATVNGADITLAELNEQYNSLPAQLQEQYTRQEVLEQLVDKELILSYAYDQGISVSQEAVDARIQEQAQQLGLDAEGIRGVLAGNNVSYDTYVDAVREELVLEQLINSLIEQQTVTDEEVLAAYEQVAANSNQSLEDVRADIEQSVKTQKASQQFTQLLDTLRQEANIEYAPAYTVAAE